MKKLLNLLLAVSVVFILSGCTDEEKETKTMAYCMFHECSDEQQRESVDKYLDSLEDFDKDLYGYEMDNHVYNIGGRVYIVMQYKSSENKPYNDGFNHIEHLKQLYDYLYETRQVYNHVEYFIISVSIEMVNEDDYSLLYLMLDEYLTIQDYNNKHIIGVNLIEHTDSMNNIETKFFSPMIDFIEEYEHFDFLGEIETTELKVGINIDATYDNVRLRYVTDSNQDNTSIMDSFESLLQSELSDQYQIVRNQ